MKIGHLWPEGKRSILLLDSSIPNGEREKRDIWRHRFASVEVFYSFAEADAPLLEQLERHLSVL